MKLSAELLIYVAIIGLNLAGCSGGISKWERQILSADNPDQRREGVQELMQKKLGKTDGAVRLFAMLAETDSDGTVRSAATQALGETDNQKAVEPLGRVLVNDTDAQVRSDAAVALGKVPGSAAARSLLKRLREDPDSQVRAACARTLSEYRYPGVVQALVAALLADDFSTAYEAQQSLEKLTEKSFETSLEWQNWLEEHGDPFVGTEVLIGAGK